MNNPTLIHVLTGALAIIGFDVKEGRFRQQAESASDFDALSAIVKSLPRSLASEEPPPIRFERLGAAVLVQREGITFVVEDDVRQMCRLTIRLRSNPLSSQPDAEFEVTLRATSDGVEVADPASFGRFERFLEIAKEKKVAGPFLQAELRLWLERFGIRAIQDSPAEAVGARA